MAIANKPNKHAVLMILSSNETLALRRIRFFITVRGFLDMVHVCVDGCKPTVDSINYSTLKADYTYEYIDIV